MRRLPLGLRLWQGLGHGNGHEPWRAKPCRAEEDLDDRASRQYVRSMSEVFLTLPRLHGYAREPSRPPAPPLPAEPERIDAALRWILRPPLSGGGAAAHSDALNDRP